MLLWIFVLIGKNFFSLSFGRGLWCLLLLLFNPDPDRCFAQSDQFVRVCFNVAEPRIDCV